MPSELHFDPKLVKRGSKGPQGPFRDVDRWEMTLTAGLPLLRVSESVSWKIDEIVLDSSGRPAFVRHDKEWFRLKAPTQRMKDYLDTRGG